MAQRSPRTNGPRRRCSPHAGELPGADAVGDTVALLQAVAHPARLLALVALSRRGPLSAGELRSLVGIEQSAMSHQLAALREARLVTAERSGRQVIYRLADEHVAHIVEDALVHAAEDRDA